MTENTGKASDIILKVDNASASFSVGGEIHRAVSNVTLEVKRGEILGVVGESGSGKTTLARMIVGIYTPDDGEIYYEGERIRAGVENKRAALREIDARGRVEFFKLVRSIFKPKAERERIIKEVLLKMMICKSYMMKLTIYIMNIICMDCQHMKNLTNFYKAKISIPSLMW